MTSSILIDVPNPGVESDVGRFIGNRWARSFASSSRPLRRAGSSVGRDHLDTMGQQSWLRLLDIENHEVLAGDAASMAPGFETPAALAASKTSDDYWAKR